jgi:hypothetical protein
MIATNELLKIGFAIVAGFTNVVQIQRGAVPTTAADLAKFVAGGPAPVPSTSLYLLDRRGNEFWIKDGTVYQFSSPGSYKELQNPSAISKFKGAPVLTSNQVVALATKTLQGLAKQGDPTEALRPSVRVPRASDQIPFYWITWPSTNRNGYSAFIEIDARSGFVTYLHLVSRSFYDYAFALQISNRVFTPDPEWAVPSDWALQRRPPLKDKVRHPGTNQVAELLQSWLWLCGKLGVDPGPKAGLPEVMWSRTFIYASEISNALPSVVVQFNNGTKFAAANGVAFSHYAADSCYVGPWQTMSRAEREGFYGTITKRWQDLAKGLENTLTEQVGLSNSLIKLFTPNPSLGVVGDVGSICMKRMVVSWRNWPDDKTRDVSIEETKLGFEAEFDLETGDLKWISFSDPQIIGALRNLQQKTR